MSCPITCHVLNTLSGTPAANLNATLTLLSPLPTGYSSILPSFRAVTNADGRVKDWEPMKGSSLSNVLGAFDDGEKTAWSLKFDIGLWYDRLGIESFWPEIEVKFYVRKGERHYHVPVLVGPWTYTTYRGS